MVKVLHHDVHFAFVFGACHPCDLNDVGMVQTAQNRYLAQRSYWKVTTLGYF